MGVDKGYGVPKPKAIAKTKVKPISPDKLNEKFRDKEWRLARYNRVEKGLWELKPNRSIGRLPERVKREGSVTRPGGLMAGLPSTLGKGPGRRYVAYNGRQAKKTY